MTLYCQDCGAVVYAPGSVSLLGDNKVGCKACGALFKQLANQTLDEFIAWLSFPPNLTPEAA